MSEERSFYSNAYSPYLQAAIALGCSVIISASAKILSSIGMGVTTRFPWISIAAFMLCFAVFNSVISISSKNLGKYWNQSILSFLALAVIGGGFAMLFSSQSISEAGSFRWLFGVVTFGYLVFLSMMRLLRFVVEFAQREEWNQPKMQSRIRKRK